MKKTSTMIYIEAKDIMYDAPLPNPVEVCDLDKNYIKHVHCNGAKFHLLSWDSNGRHCSEKNCIVNKMHNK